MIVTALRAGEVARAAGGVGGDDGGLVVVVDVAALVAPLTVSDHSASFTDHDPARNLYSQRASSENTRLLTRLILPDAHPFEEGGAEGAPGIEEAIYYVVVVLARQGQKVRVEALRLPGGEEVLGLPL